VENWKLKFLVFNMTYGYLFRCLVLCGGVILGNCKLISQRDFSGDPAVIVGNTRIIGKHEIARNGRSYSAFRGIPYAEKPERFEV